MTQSLDAVAIPLPGRQMKPGESWTSTRMVPVDNPASFETGSLAMTYTYKGLTKYRGREAALIALRGKLRGYRDRLATLAGTSHGFAYYDIQHSRITYVRHVVDVTLTITIEDVVLKATGMLRVKLDRDPQ